MTITLDLLTEEECLATRSLVHDLKEFWIQRNPDLPFYTLGAASPYDIPKNRQGYYLKAQYYNSILYNHFAWLYECIANTLKNYLKTPVCYPKQLALPGFHIFLAHKTFEHPMGAIHCDKSYMFHWQLSENIDFNNPISFTLPVCLPKHGGGMYTWDLHYQEVKVHNHSQIEEIAATRKKSFHPYKAGKLFLHSGLLVHQIAPIKSLQAEDERITLQGHALLCQDCWQLHW